MPKFCSLPSSEGFYWRTWVYIYIYIYISHTYGTNAYTCRRCCEMFRSKHHRLRMELCWWKSINFMELSIIINIPRYCWTNLSEEKSLESRTPGKAVTETSSGPRNVLGTTPGNSRWSNWNRTGPCFQHTRILIILKTLFFCVWHSAFREAILSHCLSQHLYSQPQLGFILHHNLTARCPKLETAEALCLVINWW